MFKPEQDSLFILYMFALLQQKVTDQKIQIHVIYIWLSPKKFLVLFINFILQNITIGFPKQELLMTHPNRHFYLFIFFAVYFFIILAEDY